jgi:hypothetical protein
MLVGSTPFSLFETFGNNAFSSSCVSVGGNPSYGQKNPMQGTIIALGENSGILPRKDLGIHGRDHFPCQECQPGETPSIANGTLGKAHDLCPSDQHEVTLRKILGIQCKPNLLRPIMGVI